jgi:cell division protein FtsI/penicillin-binding protein 2
MNKLYLILALIIFLIIIIIYKHYTIEYFKDDDKTPEELAKIEKDKKERTARIEQYKKDKDEKSALNYLSINTLIDISEKMNMLKTVLNDTEVKLNYDVAILNDTGTTGTSGYREQVDTINGKMTRLEGFKTDIGVKTLEIEELKDNIYAKIPKELIQKIEELAEVNIKYKNIYKDVIEITTRKEFNVTKTTIMKELEGLDKHLNELKTIMIDVITRFY